MNAHVNPDELTSSASDKAALRGEANQPAICYTLHSSQKLLPYLVLEQNHQGYYVLFLGDEYYVPQNFCEPCLMNIVGDIAYVRRASIRKEQSDRGFMRPTLAQAHGSNSDLLLLVDPKTSLPAGATLKETFWVGIETNARIVTFNRNGDQRLIAFSEDGQAADILYNDGDVVRIVRISGELTLLKLTNEEKAEVRIANALKRLNETRANKELDDQTRAKRVDGAYHQLVTILMVGGARSQTVFGKVFDLLATAADEGVLRLPVKDRALAVLKRLSQSHALEFGMRYEAVQARRTSGGAFGNVAATYTGPSTRRGPPASRLKALAARRTRDQKRHAETAGAHGGGGGQKSKAKKK